MKQLLIIIFCLASLHLSFAQTGSIKLQVEGIDVKRGGELSAGIFKDGNFPKVGKQMKGMEVLVTASRMQLTFTNITVGEYAVVVFQDVDKNKDLKTNFIGFPQEPIGFSNDARIKMGPPDFNDAKVRVEKDKELILKIILR
jgi:uncharacterized protein (DUF2141 family)